MASPIHSAVTPCEVTPCQIFVVICFTVATLADRRDDTGVGERRSSDRGSKGTIAPPTPVDASDMAVRVSDRLVRWHESGARWKAVGSSGPRRPWPGSAIVLVGEHVGGIVLVTDQLVAGPPGRVDRPGCRRRSGSRPGRSASAVDDPVRDGRGSSMARIASSRWRIESVRATELSRV